MAEKVRLSVIIVTHNQSNILRFQIAALEKQAGIVRSEIEVIVTDDASERHCQLNEKFALNWRNP